MKYLSRLSFGLLLFLGFQGITLPTPMVPSLAEIKQKLAKEAEKGTCLSTLPLARQVYSQDSSDLQALHTIAECTLEDQNISGYASEAKAIFEKSEILSVVPQILEMAQIKELIPILKEVEVKKDKNINDYLILNELYERLGEPEKQMQNLQMAIQTAPGDPRPLLLLAAKKLEGNHRDEAIQDFKRYLTQSHSHPGQIYLMIYVISLIHPTLSILALLLITWAFAYLILKSRRTRKTEASSNIDLTLKVGFVTIPSLLGLTFWLTLKALPLGAFLLFILFQAIWIIDPFLRRLYRPNLKYLGRGLYFLFNGILLARKLNDLPPGMRILISLTTLTALGTIIPTLKIPDLRYALTAICAFLFYTTLGSFLISFLRSRTSLLSSLRWISIAATLPFLISYIISNWSSLGVPILFARMPSTKVIDNFSNYLVFWGVSFFLSLHLGRIIAEALVIPIHEMTTKVARIEEGDLTAKVDVLSNDEIGNLAKAINRMGAGLERREKIERTFHKYIDKQIANRILQGCETELRIEGQSTEAVVLFADIRGYTRLSETKSPEEVVTILNQFFERMVRIVQKHDGVVDKFIGDSLMAVWGVPTPIQLAEEKSVRAALEMLAEMKIWNETLKEEDFPPLAIGIGLNAGKVIAGSLGSSEHMEYTVIGDVVNSAQRAESIAQPNELLITEAIHNKLQDKLIAKRLDPMKVKGKEIIQNYWSVSDLQNLDHNKIA